VFNSLGDAIESVGIIPREDTPSDDVLALGDEGKRERTQPAYDLAAVLSVMGAFQQLMLRYHAIPPWTHVVV
jgi:hypothetical protein